MFLAFASSALVPAT